MSNLVRLSELFNINYGNSLELINMEQCKSTDINAVPFVSRTESNNGVSAFVEKELDIDTNPAHTLTVAVSGSVLATFYQPLPYYTGFHVLVLSPKTKMNTLEMLVFAKYIKANSYQYNYGRQANKTLKDILVPRKIPGKLLEKLSLHYQELMSSITIAPQSKIKIPLNKQTWKTFSLGDIFDIKKGKRLIQNDFTSGDTPFIGAIDSNNGYRDFIGEKAIHQGNTITINYNGSVGEAFYQPKPFWASDDVNVLYPKFKFNKYIGLFIVTVIRQDKYRFNYGRKWELERMKESKILLPGIANEIDVDFMEKYIKSLRYSGNI